MSETIDLNKVGTFVRVVDAQGFTAAARLLGQPKSSVSRSVRQLEEAIGIRLLHRTTRQIRLTDAGREYYARAAHALAGLNEATRDITQQEAAPSGTVRVTAPGDLAGWVLGPVVAAFTQTYPGVRVEISVTGQLVDLVSEGVDLALRIGQLRDSSYIVRSLAPLDAGLYASKAYLEARGTPATTAEFASHQLVSMSNDGQRVRWTLVGPDGAAERISGTASIVADDFSFVYSAVASGAGIGLLPVHRCNIERNLVRLLPAFIARGGPLQLVYPSTRHLPQRVMLLRDAIIAHMTVQCRKHEKEGGVC